MPSKRQVNYAPSADQGSFFSFIKPGVPHPIPAPSVVVPGQPSDFTSPITRTGKHPNQKNIRGNVGL
jgi:hypothetical protein